MPLHSENVPCPYCGETNEIDIELLDEKQSFIEDCTVCCRPIQIVVFPERAGSDRVCDALGLKRRMTMKLSLLTEAREEGEYGLSDRAGAQGTGRGRDRDRICPAGRPDHPGLPGLRPMQ